MLVQEWDWEKYGDARERAAEKREREKWQAVVADKDAALAEIVADKDAEIAALKAQISNINKQSQ